MPGRSSQAQQLIAALLRARTGRGQIAHVVGAAGSGKTQLLREVANYAREAGALVLATTCTPDTPPLAPWRVISRAAALATGRTADGDDSPDLVTRVADAISDFDGHEQWTLLVLDDIHAADHATVEVLHLLAPMLSGRPALIIVAGRPGAMGFTAYADQVLELTGLDVDDLAEWLRALQPDAADAALQLGGARLKAITGGNPLAVRHLLEEMGGPSRLLAADSEMPGDPLGSLLASLTLLQRDVLVVDALYGESARGESVASILGLRTAEVRDALDHARGLGLLRPAIDGSDGAHVHPAVAERLLADLGPGGVCQAQARIARALEAAGNPSFDFAAHALAAGEEFTVAERARLAQEAATEAVRLYAFIDADHFFAAAIDLVDDEQLALRLLLARVDARHRSGDLLGASELALLAFRQAERLGDTDAIAEAAVRYAYPPDWRAGDDVAIELLEKAEAARPNPARLAEVLAARAVVEMRLPIRTAGGHQWGWLTRPAIAQPLAEQAVALADRSGDSLARTRAMLAWRSTHRAPEYLERRREMSQGALILAQRLRHLDLVVEAGVRASIDALEAADRMAFDEASGLVAWAADRARQPRLLWRAAVLASMRAGMSRDVDGVHGALLRARGAAASGEVPGSHVAEIAMGFQLAMMTGDVKALSAMTGNAEIMNHPLGAGGIALINALAGDKDAVPRMVADGAAKLDREASLLMSALLFGRAAVLVGDVDGARVLLPVLEPFCDRIGTDGDGFVYGGPIAGLTTVFREMLGDADGAAADAQLSTALHMRMGTTAANWVAPMHAPLAPALLTDREMRVLNGMARGLRNTDMANELNYSLATIRRETSSVFRKLKVTGRAEAVAEGYRLGLISPKS